MATYAERQANLDRVANPINEGSDRRLRIALEEDARQKLIDESDKQRQHEMNRDKQREERDSNRMRKQKILDLASRGIELPENATDAQIARAQSEHLKRKANLVIGSHENDLASNSAEYQSAYKELLGLASDSATIEEKRQALQALLNNPEAMKPLGAAQVKNLRKALSEGDPMTAVQEAAKFVGGDYWFFPGKNPAQAQAIIDTFNAPLAEVAATRKQIKYKALSDKLNDISDERKVITRALGQSYRDNAEYLDPSTLKRISSTVKDEGIAEDFGDGGAGASVDALAGGGGLKDPNSAMADLAKPAANPTPRASESEKAGLGEQLGKLDPTTIPIVGPVAAGVNAFIPGTSQNAVAAEGISALLKIAGQAWSGNKAARTIGLSDLAEERAKVRTNQPIPERPMDVPEDVKAEAHALALTVFPPEVVADGDKRLRNGDWYSPEGRKAVSTANLMIQQVLRSRSGKPAASAFPQ